MTWFAVALVAIGGRHLDDQTPSIPRRKLDVGDDLAGTLLQLGLEEGEVLTSVDLSGEAAALGHQRRQPYPEMGAQGLFGPEVRVGLQTGSAAFAGAGVSEVVDEDVPLVRYEFAATGRADTTASRAALDIADGHLDAIAQAIGQLLAEPQKLAVILSPRHHAEPDAASPPATRWAWTGCDQN